MSKEPRIAERVGKESFYLTVEQLLPGGRIAYKDDRFGLLPAWPQEVEIPYRGRCSLPGSRLVAAGARVSGRSRRCPWPRFVPVAPFRDGKVRQDGFALVAIAREYGTGTLLLLDGIGGHLLGTAATASGYNLLAKDGRVPFGQWEKVRVFPPESPDKVEREFRVGFLTFVRLRYKELWLTGGRGRTGTRLAGRLLLVVLAGEDLTLDPFLQADLVVHLFDFLLLGKGQVCHFAVFTLLAELVQSVQASVGIGRRRGGRLIRHGVALLGRSLWTLIRREEPLKVPIPQQDGFLALGLGRSGGRGRGRGPDR